MINKHFPSTSNATFDNNATTISTTDQTISNKPTDAELAPCGCPLRLASPALPEKIPFPATADYRQQFEDWIKKRYASSAFNTCPHQKLQKTKGEPLRITFVPDHVPYAAHKPITVPHHWKKKVKKKLDADVALGIIEPVPQGTPTK